MNVEFSPLSNEQIMLRCFTGDDINARYLSWLTDPDVVKYSNQRFRTHSMESSQAYLQSFKDSENLFLAIIDQASNQMVGTLTIYLSVPHKTADIGILVGDKTKWGRGIGLAAWQLAMSYVLNILQFRKVTGGTLRPNQAMVRIMEKAGMTLEAVRERQELLDGEEVDILYYAKFAD